MTTSKSVSAQDTLATHLREINRRLASLERAASSADLSSLGDLALLDMVDSAHITDGTIVDGDIAVNTISVGRQQQVTGPVFRGRSPATLGNLQDLTTAQATAMLDLVTTALKGLVPSGGAATSYFRGDPSWVTGKILVASGQADCTTNLTVGATLTDIAGMTTGALALLTGDLVFVDIAADTRQDTAAQTCVVHLDINGTDQTQQMILGGSGIPAALRVMMSKRWRYTVPSNGNYTFKARAQQASGASTIQTPHSGIVWQVFR